MSTTIGKPSIKVKYGGRNVTLDFMWKEIEDRTAKKALNIVRRAALQTANSIKGMTPVLTGQAAHNWTIGLNGYKKEEYVQYDKEVDQEYDPYGPVSYTPLLNMKMTDKITINNETPYIRELEHGHSRKAPQGMVKVNLMMWNEQLKFAKNEISSGMKWYET